MSSPQWPPPPNQQQPWAAPPIPPQQPPGGGRSWPTAAVITVIAAPLLGIAIGYALGSLGGGSASPAERVTVTETEFDAAGSFVFPSELPTVELPTTTAPTILPGELVAGNYTFSDVQHYCDYDYFQARARVVTEQPPAEGAGFTLTFFEVGGSVVGTASASVDKLQPAQAATVEFNSTDACSAVDRVEIQLDYEY